MHKNKLWVLIRSTLALLMSEYQQHTFVPISEKNIYLIPWLISSYMNRYIQQTSKGINGPVYFQSVTFTGTVAQLVEHPLCDQEGPGSIPGWAIPKTLKMVLAALSLGAQHYERRARNQNWSAQCQYKTGWNIMSSVWGDLFHSKSEHWVPCHIQTPSRYDWKIVESDSKTDVSLYDPDLYFTIECVIFMSTLMFSSISDRLYNNGLQ